MDRDQYKEKVTVDILYELAKEVCSHDRDYTPSSITEDYWLLDLKNALLHADRNNHPYQVYLRGYGIEIHSKGKWYVVVYFRAGKIIIGENFIEVDCLERAIEDLRFLCGLIPKYTDKYTEAMRNAVIEMKKETMIQEIYEASVMPVLSELLKDRNLSCRTKKNFKTISLYLISGKVIVNTFYIPYDDFQNELQQIKSFIEKAYPVTKEDVPDLSRDCV